MNKTRVIFLGGNTTKTWDASKNCGEMTYGTIAHITRFLNSYENFTSTFICLKESTDLTDNDYAQLKTQIHVCPEEKIIIIQGTKTIPQTIDQLKGLGDGETKLGKKIVLFGSVYPWEMETKDAKLLFGCALGFLANAPEDTISSIDNRTLEISTHQFSVAYS